ATSAYTATGTPIRASRWERAAPTRSPCSRYHTIRVPPQNGPLVWNIAYQPQPPSRSGLRSVGLNANTYPNAAPSIAHTSSGGHPTYARRAARCGSRWEGCSAEHAGLIDGAGAHPDGDRRPGVGGRHLEP